MRLFTLFCLISLFSSCLFAQKGKVFFDILDRETNLPISNTEIRIYKGVSDSVLLQAENGKAEVYLPYGKYSIFINQNNYIFEKVDITVESALQYYKVLSKKLVHIPEIEITSLGIPKKISTIITPVTVLKNNEIMQQSSLTPADALSQVSGVYVARDGAWASAVNLRGLSEQRIVTLIDGFRVETASELAGGFGMIDLNNIARVEVIKGSVSDLQGTGAVGGLINYVSHESYYSDKAYTGGKFIQQYQSVNGLKGTHLNLNTGTNNWWFRVSGSLRNAADMRTPDGKLPNSSFADEAINMKAAFKITNSQELKLTYQKFKAEDVGITGGNFAQTAVVWYKNASRDLAGLNYTIKNSNRDGAWKQANLSGFYQFIERDVEVDVNPTVTLKPVGKHTTIGAKGNSEWNIIDNLNVEVGAEMWQREMTSFRKKTTVSATAVTTILGELPLPHAWYTSTGSYIMSNYKPLSFLKLSVSARGDLIHIKNDEAITPQYQIVNGITQNPPANQRIIFASGNQDNHSFSFQGGVGIQIDKQNKINLTVAKSFRSPSLEERFKYIDLGAKVSYGNPALKPENGWFYNIGYAFNSTYIDFKLDGYINNIHNYITSIPGTFSYVTPSKLNDTLKIAADVAANLNNALLQGGEVSANIYTQSPISFTLQASYVRGIEKLSNTNLPLMPPLHGLLAIHYVIENCGKITAQVVMADKQTKVAEKELTTGGYALYNLSAESTDFNLYYFRLKCFTGIDNITNRAWRNHLATNRGLMRLEAGRNVYVKVQINW